MTFAKDNSFGKTYENKLRIWILSHTGVKVEGTPVDNFPEWDLKATAPDGSILTFECKADRKCKETGNLYIELGRSDGRKSGLSATTADYWVFYVDGTENFYVVPTTEVRAVVSKYPQKAHKQYKNVAACVPVAEFNKWRNPVLLKALCVERRNVIITNKHKLNVKN
jgi:hypothetical protein